MMRTRSPHLFLIALFVLFFSVPAFAAGTKVTLTAYNAVKAQTGPHPGTTGSGIRSNPETVAAVSPRLKATRFPYGTIVRILPDANAMPTRCGLSKVLHLVGKYRIVADVTAGKRPHNIDVLLPQKAHVDGRRVNPADLVGVCHGVTVTTVAHVDLRDPARVPKTQAELAALVQKQQWLQSQISQNFFAAKDASASFNYLFARANAACTCISVC